MLAPLEVNAPGPLEVLAVAELLEEVEATALLGLVEARRLRHWHRCRSAKAKAPLELVEALGLLEEVKSPA